MLMRLKQSCGRGQAAGQRGESSSRLVHSCTESTTGRSFSRGGKKIGRNDSREVDSTAMVRLAVYPQGSQRERVRPFRFCVKRERYFPAVCHAGCVFWRQPRVEIAFAPFALPVVRFRPCASLLREIYFANLRSRPDLRPTSRGGCRASLAVPPSWSRCWAARLARRRTCKPRYRRSSKRCQPVSPPCRACPKSKPGIARLQLAGWPRLAEGEGSLRRGVSLTAASGEPAGRGLCTMGSRTAACHCYACGAHRPMLTATSTLTDKQPSSLDPPLTDRTFFTTGAAAHHRERESVQDPARQPSLVRPHRLRLGRGRRSLG